MRLTEINLFGVYVAPMSSMTGCRLGGDDRTALVAARFGLTQYVLLAQRHRRRVAAQKVSTPGVSITNVLLSPDFMRLRGELLQVLDRYPEARDEVAAVFRRLKAVGEIGAAQMIEPPPANAA